MRDDEGRDTARAGERAPPEAEPGSETGDLGPRHLRRILVALDASPASRYAAQAAVELAVQVQARLEGLFVEDEALLELAALPLAAPWGGRGSGGAAEADSPWSSEAWGEEAVERRLRALAVRARAVLEEVARERGLEAGFRVRRGRVTEEILRGVEDADVLVLGRVGWSGGRTGRLGRTAAAVLARSQGVLLPYGTSGRAVLRLLLR